MEWSSPGLLTALLSNGTRLSPYVHVQDVWLLKASSSSTSPGDEAGVNIVVMNPRYHKEKMVIYIYGSLQILLRFVVVIDLSVTTRCIHVLEFDIIFLRD